MKAFIKFRLIENPGRLTLEIDEQRAKTLPSPDGNDPIRITVLYLKGMSNLNPSQEIEVEVRQDTVPEIRFVPNPLSINPIQLKTLFLVGSIHLRRSCTSLLNPRLMTSVKKQIVGAIIGWRRSFELPTGSRIVVDLEEVELTSDDVYEF